LQEEQLRICRLFRTGFIILFYINIFIVYFTASQAEEFSDCKWNNKDGTPCLTISKTNNSSKVSEAGVSKIVINRQDIESSGYNNLTDILKSISGLNVYQSGEKGQSSSVFTRGAESNHTLVLLNGIAINDQSVTDGMHDFGQDFLQSFQQIEIYKGSSGAHFGPSAIAGAINLTTTTNYTNSYSIKGFNDRNNSFEGNYTKIADNGWHLNINGTTNQSYLGSAYSDGNEKDGTFNKQLNLNAEKWMNDNTKLKSTFYVRETRSYYDDMDYNGEYGYVMDNTMQAFQTGVERVNKNKEDYLTFHWHSYAKDIDDGGYSDSYDSQALVTRYEKKVGISENSSFGFGSEYKYDWGGFENEGSFNSSSRGHVKDFAIFANVGYKIFDNSTLSLYGRNDDHNTAGKNNTFKLSLLQKINNFEFGASHSTGVRNPTLYELFGSNNYGYKGDINLKAEKSKTNEIFGKYDLSEILTLKSTIYRTTLLDRLESNASFTATENKTIDLDHEGLESELTYEGQNQKLSLFATFSKSKTEKGVSQQRRPDLNYGINLSKKFINTSIGPFNMNLNYKFTGKHLDYDGGTAVAPETDIINVNFSKNIFGSLLNLSISNLLNEKYEKPLTYFKDGRQLRLGLKKLY